MAKLLFKKKISIATQKTCRKCRNSLSDKNTGHAFAASPLKQNTVLNVT